jgi:electron-transferring-flavoprotein dehydrogenase
MTDDPGLPPRESMEYDVVIVGAGPAGLSAALRLKSLDANTSVVVVEKGSTVGAHILSGAVIDPIGLDRLTPDWRSDPECPLKTQVANDQFYFLTEKGSLPLPNWAMPRLMSNHGNFIGSLGALTRWLAARAEAQGVEIYPGFAATELLFGEKGEVVGVATGDMGGIVTENRRRTLRAELSCAENMCSLPKGLAGRYRNRPSLALLSIP